MQHRKHRVFRGIMRIHRGSSSASIAPHGRDRRLRDRCRPDVQALVDHDLIAARTAFS